MARTYTGYSPHFDASQGTLLEVWHTYREEGISLNEAGEDGRLPEEAELQRAANAQSWDAVRIDEESNEVMIIDPDVSLDLGGIAKGYAVEQVKRELEEKGVDGAILNAGGNVVTIGEKSDGSAWRVGVQMPSSLSDSTLAVLELNGSHAIVTSGDYQRYYEVNGERYAHIIDPLTLYPPRHFRAVTVVCDDSAAADCISTTLFTLTYEEGLAYLSTLEGAVGVRRQRDDPAERAYLQHARLYHRDDAGALRSRPRILTPVTKRLHAIAHMCVFGMQPFFIA